MKLEANEKRIECRWIVEGTNVVEDDNCKRIHWLKQNYLILINVDVSGWIETYQDPEDGRYWQYSFPHSEIQGGGPTLLECVEWQVV